MDIVEEFYICGCWWEDEFMYDFFFGKWFEWEMSWFLGFLWKWIFEIDFLCEFFVFWEMRCGLGREGFLFCVLEGLICVFFLCLLELEVFMLLLGMEEGLEIKMFDEYFEELLFVECFFEYEIKNLLEMILLDIWYLLFWLLSFLVLEKWFLEL